MTEAVRGSRGTTHAAVIARRGVAVHIFCDLVHVLEYCWHPVHRRRPTAQQHVAAWALSLLAGNIDQFIGDMTTRAATLPTHHRDGLKAAVR
ncbi:hypothetical protein GCM10009678_77920 [Actinomadura kijaniata]|uniref:Transposase n=1 Tax=Actinomadura namibiensis TaxID=182080 RepID=A0A7W3LVJ6_ACTNM|nr:hypothetical protein [Actinomadura namibiensis]MBA8955027.1 hypothetical protein [Actinomadura namibiensis]